MAWSIAAFALIALTELIVAVRVAYPGHAPVPRSALLGSIIVGNVVAGIALFLSSQRTSPASVTLLLAWLGLDTLTTVLTAFHVDFPSVGWVSLYVGVLLLAIVGFVLLSLPSNAVGRVLALLASAGAVAAAVLGVVLDSYTTRELTPADEHAFEGLLSWYRWAFALLMFAFGAWLLFAKKRRIANDWTA